MRAIHTRFAPPPNTVFMLGMMLILFWAGTFPAWGLDSGALPTGGEIVSGTGGISQSGNTMAITQTTERMITNWRSFDIGRDASVAFLQPGASSVALNRIQGERPSEIFGALTANGQVFLLNPAGVIFGKSAQVNVGGLVASSLALSDEDFLNGRYAFTGSAGSIENYGSITAAGGYVAFLSPVVKNEGSITAENGRVILAAGGQVTLDFAGGSLVSFTVDKGVVDALAENRGLIKADNGIVHMTAKAADAIVQSVVNNTGVVEARGITAQGGRIILDAAGGQTTVSGTLDASSETGTGGSILATGDNVLVGSGAHLNASGATGGGEVLVGGGWQGGDGSIHEATGTVVAAGALLEANATVTGNGGTVVAWSDVNNKNSVTRVYGTLEAKGGADGGDGGRVETSGHWLDVGSAPDVGASSGKGGLWLIDPYNITIVSGSGNGNINAASPFASTGDTASLGIDLINTALESGDVTIQTGAGGTQAGDITWDTTYTYAGSAARTLTLSAHRDILLNYSIGSSSGALNLALTADSDSNGTGETVVKGDLTTRGGSIAFNGLGAIFSGSSAQTLSTSGGNVTVNGETLIANTNGLTINSGNGSVTFASTVDSGSLAPSALTVDAGSGAVIFSGAVGAGKALASLNVAAAATEINGGAVTTTGAQTYNSNITLGAAATTLTQTDPGTDFTLQTGKSITNASGSDATLTIKTTGGIILGAGSSISSGIGALSTVLWADSDADSGGGKIELNSGAFITTNGGNLWLGGGVGATVWNGLTVGNGSAVNPLGDGVYLYNAFLSSGAGDISVSGKSTGSNGINISTGSYVASTGSGAVSLTATSGDITGTGYVVSGGTTTLTANPADNIILTNAGNDFTGAVSVVSGKNIAVVDKNAMTLGNVTASGTVDIATLSNNLTLAGTIQTTDATAGAVKLNAGKNMADGTATGGDIIVSGGSVSVGSGGRATFYTGSLLGSTGLSALIGTGSGKFRYNSDELMANYSMALGAGSYAVYREQPILTVTADDKTVIYGTAPSLSTSLSGLQNGDSIAQAISAESTVSISGSKSTSGNYTAETAHVLTASGAESGFGYGFTYADGTLIVGKLDLTGSIGARSSVYGSALVVGAASLTNKISGDAVTATVAVDTTGNTSTSGNLNAGSYTGIEYISALSGADAANYTYGSVVGDYTVNQLALTGTIGAGSSVYGSALAPGAVNLTNKIAGDAVVATVDVDTIGLTSTSGNLIAGTHTGKEYISALGGADAANYTYGSVVGDYSVSQLALTGTIGAGSSVYGSALAPGAANLTNKIAGDAVTATTCR